MKSNLLRRLVKNFSIGGIVLITILLVLFLNFVVVKGQEPSNSEKNTSETNILIRQISFINEEILKDKLSPQMRSSLNEKLVLLQNYADMIVKGKRSAAIKDENLITISPEVNDPPFQQGIFPGGNHLLTDEAFTSNNYFQTESQGNYYQVVAGKNLSTISGVLYMIITSEDKINTEIFYIKLPESIQDLIITSSKRNSITLLDQDNQFYRFDLETKQLNPEN